MGAAAIDAAYVGSSAVDAIYLGATQVYGGGSTPTTYAGGNSGSTAAVDITVSYTPTVGNLLVAVLKCASDHTIHATTDSGWTKITGGQASAATAATSIWWKEADTDTGHTFSGNGGSSASHQLIVTEYAGDFDFADLVMGTVSDIDPGANVTSLAVGDLVTSAKSLIVAVAGTNATSTLSWATSTTAQSTIRSVLGYQLDAAAGTYSDTLTLGTATRVIGFLVALRNA
jgi:hypothetical protein